MQTRVARLHGVRDLRIEMQDFPQPAAGEVLLAMAAGGICGSDLHYYQDGGFGPIRVREPIIAGHEASGRVEALGAGVEGLHIGQLVSINPSQPCGRCHYCQIGQPIHCLEMRFMGSAMRLPHEQGLFRDHLTLPADRCHPVPDTITPGEAACAEPLAVGLHAAAQAGALQDRKVLVTGAGPIGLLTVAAIRHAGAAEIIVTDLMDAALARAPAMGASATVNVATNPEGLAPYQAEKGQFDIVFDCSAAAPALRSALACLRPRGTMVQVGVTGDLPIPLNLLVSKEITWRGSQRFDREFSEAVALIARRAIDVRPIISHSFPLEQALLAFEQAGNRALGCKVQLSFSKPH